MSFKEGDICIVNDLAPERFVGCIVKVCSKLGMSHLGPNRLIASIIKSNGYYPEQSGAHFFYTRELDPIPVNNNLCKVCYSTITTKTICCDCASQNKTSK